MLYYYGVRAGVHDIAPDDLRIGRKILQFFLELVP